MPSIRWISLLPDQPDRHAAKHKQLMQLFQLTGILTTECILTGLSGANAAGARFKLVMKRRVARVAACRGWTCKEAAARGLWSND